jgi:hypothetical protein
LIFDTEYRGFVLLGAHFSVFDGSSWVSPVEAEKVKVELRKLDTHGAAIESLRVALSALKMAPDNDPQEVTVDQLSSSQKIMDQMKARVIPDESVADIDRSLHGLIWGKPYVQLNPDNFLRFLDNAFAETEVLVPDDQPVYIPSCRAPLDSNFFRHLGAFGPDVPSLWHTSGSKISVIDSKRKADGASVDQPEVPKEVIILPKPALVAMKDWGTIMKTGTVSFNLKERAREYRGHVVKEEGIRKKLWLSLQKGLLANSLVEDGESSKKKARVDGPDVVTSVSDMLDLF